VLFGLSEYEWQMKIAIQRKGAIMKIVVIGGTGLIGSKLVTKLREHGHEAAPESPNLGVNTLTGEGLAYVLKRASVVVDISNSPSFDEEVAMNFFKTATRNLIQYEQTAGVRHHIALSVVGTDRLAQKRQSDGPHTIRGYFRAKLLRSSHLNDSIHGSADSNPSNCRCHIFCGHGLDEHWCQSDCCAVARRIRNILDEHHTPV
jgi:hypothetical protein